MHARMHAVLRSPCDPAALSDHVFLSLIRGFLNFQTLLDCTSNGSDM